MRRADITISPLLTKSQAVLSASNAFNSTTKSAHDDSPVRSPEANENQKKLIENIDQIFNDAKSPQRVLQNFDTNGEVVLHHNDELGASSLSFASKSPTQRKYQYTKEQIKQKMAEDDGKKSLQMAHEKLLWAQYRQYRAEKRQKDSTKHLRSPFESQIDLYVDAKDDDTTAMGRTGAKWQSTTNSPRAHVTDEAKQQVADEEILLTLIRDHDIKSFQGLQVAKKSMHEAKQHLEDYGNKIFRLKANLEHINQTYRKSEIDVSIASPTNKLWSVDLQFSSIIKQRREMLRDAGKNVVVGAKAGTRASVPNLAGAHARPGIATSSNEDEIQRAQEDIIDAYYRQFAQPDKNELLILRIHEDLRKKKMKKRFPIKNLYNNM